MFYVHCIFCDCTYSAEGNPYYMTDDGETICDKCIDHTIEVDKSESNGIVTYTLSNDYLLDIHEDLCNSIDNFLNAHDDVVQFEKTELSNCRCTYRFQSEDLSMAALAGLNLDYVFYYC